MADGCPNPQGDEQRLHEYRTGGGSLEDSGQPTIRLICTQWGRLNMVARAGRYFGRLFKGCHGVTQGNPFSTKIFNVVVDAFIRH